jgi:small subunit ribosomal protein S20
MANIASSKKDARTSAARAVRNRAIKSAVKTKVTKFRRAAAEGAEDLGQLAEVAVSTLDRAVAKGVLHRNNAARRKARLVKRLNATGAEQPAAAAKPAAKPSAAKGKAGAAKAKPAAAKKPAPRKTAAKKS